MLFLMSHRLVLDIIYEIAVLFILKTSDGCSRKDHAAAMVVSWYSRRILELDNYRRITWWWGCAPRDLVHATNNRDNRPSMYRRRQRTQSRRIDVKAQTRWTAVWRSTTPSGIERTSCKPLETQMRSTESCIVLKMAAKKSPRTIRTWIHIVLVGIAVQITY